MEGRPKALHVQVGRTHIEVDAGVRSLDELRAHNGVRAEVLEEYPRDPSLAIFM